MSLCFDFLWSIACIIKIVHHDNVSVGIYRADQLFKILTRPYWKGHGCVCYIIEVKNTPWILQMGMEVAEFCELYLEGWP